MAADDEATQTVERISDSASAEYVARDIQLVSDDVPPGYKRTKIGVLPESWNVNRLIDICTPSGIVRGPFGGALKKEIFQSSGFKVYEQRNAIYRNYNIGSYFISARKHHELARFSIKSGDFIISCSGTIGCIYRIPGNAPNGIINQALLKLSINNSTTDSDFFYFYFEWETFQERIIDSTQGGAMKNLVGMDVFRETSFAVPPIEEQHAIATALSDVDGLIDALDKLIAKKRGIKQAAMQQLLTGRTRLPGFSGAWGTKRLGHVASIRDKKIWPSTVPSHTPCIELEHIGQTDGQLLDASNAGHSVSTKYWFESGDVLFGRLRPYLRKYWLADFGGLCTTEIWPLVADNIQVTNGYLYALVQTDRFIDEASISYGTHMPRADWQIIAALEINLPPIEEQTAIATVLSDMDAEIDALEQRRAKTCELKTGMMQQLLTGMIRLI